MRVEVPALTFEELKSKAASEDSATVRERVNRARALAAERYREWGVKCNGELSGALTKKLCQTDSAAEEILRESFSRLGLSARGYDRILRLARTVADLEEADIIGEEHVLEAVQYRVSTEKYFV